MPIRSFLAKLPFFPTLLNDAEHLAGGLRPPDPPGENASHGGYGFVFMQKHHFSTFHPSLPLEEKDEKLLLHLFGTLCVACGV